MNMIEKFVWDCVPASHLQAIKEELEFLPLAGGRVQVEQVGLNSAEIYMDPPVRLTLFSQSPLLSWMNPSSIQIDGNSVDVFTANLWANLGALVEQEELC